MLAWVASRAAGPLALAARPRAPLLQLSLSSFSTAAAPAAPAAQPRGAKPISLPADLRPTFVNGCWREPRLSARKAAKLRKAALIAGAVKVGASQPGAGRMPCCCWHVAASSVCVCFYVGEVKDVV